MARGSRWFLPDGVYRTRDRRHLHLRRRRRPPAFLHLLEQVRRRFRWSLSAYCLLGTHYHLLVETTEENLSIGMHRPNFLYAVRFNYRHGLDGHLFQGRFHSVTCPAASWGLTSGRGGSGHAAAQP